MIITIPSSPCHQNTLELLAPVLRPHQLLLKATNPQFKQPNQLSIRFPIDFMVLLSCPLLNLVFISVQFLSFLPPPRLPQLELKLLPLELEIADLCCESAGVLLLGLQG
jgi:hypothetical protein